MGDDQAPLSANNSGGEPVDVGAWKEHCLAAKRAFEQARYGEAATHYEAALREIESAGFSDPRFASTLNGLAGAYSAGRRYDEAKSLYQHVLALRKAAFGPQSIQAAQTLNDLAALYAASRKFSDAERAYREGLAITEAARGLEDISLCASLNNLALLYKNQQRTDEALPLFQRALRIGLKSFGHAHPFVATSLNNLAAICVDRKKYAEAEALFKQSLAIKELSGGPQHPDVATVLNNLGELYCTTGRAGDARPLFERVLRIDESAYGPRHPEVAFDLMRLASLAEAEGDVTAAQQFCQRAIEIREAALGRDHPLAVKSRSKLGAISQERGGETPQLAPAAPEPKSAMEPTGPEVIEDAPQASSIASGAETSIPELPSLEAPDLMPDVQAPAPARPQARVLAMPAAEPGIDRPGAAQSLCELADRAASEGRWQGAESLYQRELEIERSIRGDENACVAATLNNLGCVKQSQARLEEAAALFQASLSIWMDLQEYQRVAVVLNNLAVVSADQKNRAGAEALYRQSVQVHQSAPGARADQLAVIAGNLDALRNTQVGESTLAEGSGF